MKQMQIWRILLATLGIIAGTAPIAGGPEAATSWREPILSILPVSTPPNSARYTIDAAQSRFTVKALSGGLLSAFAHDHTIAIRDFTGETSFTFGTVEPASLQITIKSGSLAITDKVSEKDRQKIEATMRDEVLEVSKHPEITFKSNNVSASKTGDGQFQARISGDITLRGVSRPLTISARLEFHEKSMRAQGGFTLKQTTFGIKPVSVAGGTIKVKNDLKFTFDIIAHP